MSAPIIISPPLNYNCISTPAQLILRIISGFPNNITKSQLGFKDSSLALGPTGTQVLLWSAP